MQPDVAWLWCATKHLIAPSQRGGELAHTVLTARIRSIPALSMFRPSLQSDSECHGERQDDHTNDDARNDLGQKMCSPE